MSQSFEIRPMETGDLSAVIAIQETIIQQKVAPAWVEHLEATVGAKSSRCLVAEEAGQVIGFIIAEVNFGAFGADLSGWLSYVGVSPKKMGLGVGSSLARALFDIFKKEGVTNVRTAVRWDSVDMLSFFKSLGFDRSKFINLHKRLG